MGKEPVLEENQQKQEAVQVQEPKSSKGMLIFGGIVLAFAVIGLIATVWFLGRTISGLSGSSDKEKDAYEWLITPVVLQDPPTFESPDKLIDTTIITAGVWRLIMNEDTSKYPADQMNFITVPQSDIEVQIKALFGDVKYIHQSVGDTELFIAYDEESKSYIFPAVPHVLAYTPEVQEIQKEDDKIILTVGYIPPGPVWQGDVSGNKYSPSAEKIMTYTLQETEKGDLRIYSVTGASGDGSDFLSSGEAVPSGEEVPGEEVSGIDESVSDAGEESPVVVEDGSEPESSAEPPAEE